MPVPVSDLSGPFAGQEVAVDRRIEGRFKPRHGAAVKADDVVNIDHAADADFVFGIKIHAGGVAAVSYVVYGSTTADTMHPFTQCS